MIDKDTVLHYFIKDHLGTTRLTIREDSVVTGRYYRYYAFGETESENVSLNQEYKYTGKPIDEEFDLDIYYYGARYYQPSLGRWIAVDPMKDKYPSLSPYLYCANNPMKYIDRDGEAMVYPIPSREEYKENMPDWVPDCASDIMYDIQMDPTIGPAAIRGPGTKATSSIFSKVFNAIKRGLKNERRVLKQQGLIKNTKKITATDPKTNKVGKTIPDAVFDDGTTIDIKDRKYLSDSPQLRRQSEISKEAGKKAKIITGEKTKVSKKVEERMNVKRLPEIGPQDE